MRVSTLKDLGLAPLSWAWEWAYRLRRSGYEYGFFGREYFKVPVISVGNLTFGGTGKTPLIVWLTDVLAEHSLTPAVLTRGYKGDFEHGAGLIRAGQRFRLNPQDYGDEPLMIASKMQRGAVIVGKQRAKNLVRYFPEVRPDVVLLDDGFQHLKIYRSFNIVLFDATMPYERYKTAPAGYLREGLTALKDADAIIVSRADLVSPERLRDLRVFLSRFHHHGPLWCEVGYRVVGLVDGTGHRSQPASELSGKRVIAVSAIASPEAFYRTLESQGAQIVEKVSFSDHYFFTETDVNDLLLKASRHSALVVCSEKDMVKLRRVSQDPRLWSLRICVEFLSGEDSLRAALGKVLRLESHGQSI